MNWHHKCRLCLTDGPQRPIHALEFPELVTTLKDIFEIEILPHDNMDLVCCTCMGIISKVKFFKSNQNVIKECRGFCINLGIKQEKDDRDDDCILLEDVENPKPAEVISNVNTRKRKLDSTLKISPEKQNESAASESSNNESPKIKNCKVVVSRLKLDNITSNNKFSKNVENSIKNNNFEQSNSPNCRKDKEKTTSAIIPPKKSDNSTEKEPKMAPLTIDANVMSKIFLANKQKLPERSPTSTFNCIPKNIQWMPVELTQQAICTDAKIPSSRLSFASNNSKCIPTILKLPSTLKINQIPSTAPSFFLESLPKNNKIAFNSMFHPISALPVATTTQIRLNNESMKSSSVNKVDSKQETLASPTTILNPRPIKSIKIATVPISTSAQPFERINLPMKLDSHSTLETHRILNSKINLRNNSKVKVLSVNELNKKPELTKSQSTTPLFSSSVPSQGALIGVVNPNNSNATELTVRFIRQSSKFCIIILLYGRIVTFRDLDSHQLQCLKRLLAKNLKTNMNTHRFLLTHSPDEETLKLLRVLHIDHLLKRNH